MVHGWCSPCAADRFRVLLKGEHPDYLHAVFAHVSSKGVGPGRGGTGGGGGGGGGGVISTWAEIEVGGR